jgi:C4-dicarboxylate-specific signal transduction histidine kinase
VPLSDDSASDARIARAVAELSDVLLGVAQGEFGVRADRDFSGSPMDVLAFLVNSMAVEVGDLVRQLHEERQELQRTRNQLMLAAKLASLGELAAGVAHELNQPLTAIHMLVDLLRARPNLTIAESHRDLETLSEAARRMGRIVDSIRMFGRAAPLKLVPLPAPAPVQAALALLTEGLERQGVRAELRLAPALPEIMGDADRLQQVFINLLTNARDALGELPAQASPELIIEIRGEDDRVVYSFTDNGPGIPEPIAQRIFDPFFTTKGVGVGTGLGLSVSHGIVGEHAGVLRHEPVRPRGSRFVVELPKVAERGHP